MGLLDFAKTGADILQRNFGVDVTPGMNLTRDAGGGIPFVSQNDQGRYTAPAGSQTSNNTGGGEVLGAPQPNTNITYTDPATVAARAAAAQRAQQVGQYDQAIGQYNQQLGRLPSQLDIALGNVGRQFGVKSNELQGSFNQAQTGYKTDTSRNSQQYVGNKNQINDGYSQGLRGMLSMLGAYGANGSDRGLASGVAATDAARQRSGASQTFGENQQNLDTNWGQFQGNYKNSEKQLNDWRGEQEQSARSNNMSNKQNILSKLAELSAQRASAAGGNPAASAQTYLDQINGLQGQIDQLGAFNPTYNGTTPQYTAPTLDSYNYDATRGAEAQNIQDSQMSPYLSMLMGGKKREQSASPLTF